MFSFVARLLGSTTQEEKKDMNRRRFLGLPFLAFGVSHGMAWAPSPNEKTENAYAKTISWFQAMFRPVEELAAAIDRLRLLGYLQDLEKVCDDMISDKGEVALLLARKPVSRDALRAVLNRLHRNVDLTKTRVQRIRSVLREEFSKKGEGVSEELSDNLLTRKSWVQELEFKIPYASDQDLATFAKSATESKEALKEANLKLSELVNFLAHPK